MRIRRHAHLAASLPLSACSLAASLQSRLPAASSSAATPSVCELNQSPWDVIPFSPDSPLPSHIQGFWRAWQPTTPEDRNGGPDCNGVHNEAAVKLEEEESGGEKQLCPNVKLEVEEEEEKNMCRKTGSKGWKCTRKAEKGQSLCDHHLALRQFYHSRSGRPKSGAAAGKSRRRRASQQQGSSDFYYYSGFGPRWRKRRGQTAEEEPPPSQPLVSQSGQSSSTTDSAAESSSGEDAGGDGGGGEESREERKGKRRKRMKSRSLMSLL